MLVTTRTRSKINIKLGNSVVEEVDNFKYLGIILQNNLKFNMYVSELTSRISSAAGVIYSLRNFLPDKSLKKLYYTLVYPHLRIHILAWGLSSDTVLQPLRVALNRVIRSLSFGCHGMSTRDLYNRHDILNIDKLFKFKICQFMYKEHTEGSCMFFNVREDLSGYIHMALGTLDHNYRHPLNRLRLTETYFLNDALRIWSEIPLEMNNAPTPSFQIENSKMCKS
jgi:hypothetical protein